jgi:hypothetical protein
MSDLVERLRDPSSRNEYARELDRKEAADEITRLTREVEAMKERLAEVKQIVDRWNSDADYTDQNAIYAIDSAFPCSEALAPAAQGTERKICDCVYPHPAKYVPDYCGICHGTITGTQGAAK